MTEKIQTKFVFKNVFKTVDDWLKEKEKAINKETDISNYLTDDNDELVFKNAYKNFDQYVNNVFNSDVSIKDYLRGRNQEQQKVFDSSFFKNVYSRSLEYQNYIKSKGGNSNTSPKSSPFSKQSPLSQTLRPLNLHNVTNMSPDANKNTSKTVYGSFRESIHKQEHLFNKTSHFFKRSSKIEQNSKCLVKVHKVKVPDNSIQQLQQPSKMSKEGSLKLFRNSLQQSSLNNSSNMIKEISLRNNTASKDAPIIELEASNILETNMSHERPSINDLLKEQDDYKAQNDIYNTHILSSKQLLKEQNPDELIGSTLSFVPHQSKNLTGEPEFIPIQKRHQNKQHQQQLNVNIYRLHNFLKEEMQRDSSFNLRLPLACVQVLNLLCEYTQDDLYRTLSKVIQKNIFCCDPSIIEILSNQMKIKFQSKVYAYWELINEVSNLIDSNQKGNEYKIRNLQSKIDELSEEVNLLRKENEEYKVNIQTIQKKCEIEYLNEKNLLSEQLTNKIKECAKLQDEISLYKKQLKTQEGIYLQNETEMKMFAKSLESQFSTSITTMEQNIKDLNHLNTNQSNKIFVMQDSYASQLVRERIFDLETKMSLILEENSRLNARAGTNFYDLTPRPSFGCLDQILNPNGPILSDDIFGRKTTQSINFKQKSTRKKVEDKSKQLQNYIDNMKNSYENKIRELVVQQQLIQTAGEQKKKVKQPVGKSVKVIKDKSIIQVNPQSKASIGIDIEDNVAKSGNEHESDRMINVKKQTLSHNLSLSQKHSQEFDSNQIY